MKLKEIAQINFSLKHIVFLNHLGWRHRLDGPAYMNNRKYKEWWVNGNFIRMCKGEDET